MLLHEVPDFAAHNARPGAALHFEGRRRSWADFAADCRALAQALAATAGPGAHVAVLSGNRPEFLARCFAVPAARQLMVPLNTRLGPRELAQQLEDAEPALLFTEQDFLPLLQPLLQEAEAARGQRVSVIVFGPAWDDWVAAAAALPAPPLPPAHDDDPAWLLFTSGTTGRAKAALITLRNLIAAACNTLAAFDHHPDEVALYLFPMFHIAAYALIVYLLRGWTVVLMRGFEVHAYLEAVQRHRVTMHAIAPTMLAMVLDHPELDRHDTSSLRLMVYGASAMPAEIIRRAMARWPGVGFGTAFGMTELAGNVLHLNAAAHRRALADAPQLLASCGSAMPLARVRIVDDEGRDVPEGQPGELAVRGDQVFAGYWRNDAANAAAFRDGWFLTGDIGRRDAEGYVTIVDRKKNMIVSGGENVYSREVENLLYEHPAVAEVAVVGLPHPLWGEQVAAILRLRDGAPADVEAALDAFCRERIAGYKRPRRWVMVDALPKTPAGKIQKAELRRRLFDGSLAPLADGPLQGTR